MTGAERAQLIAALTDAIAKGYSCMSITTVSKLEAKLVELLEGI